MPFEESYCEDLCHHYPSSSFKRYEPPIELLKNIVLVNYLNMNNMCFIDGDKIYIRISDNEVEEFDASKYGYKVIWSEEVPDDKYQELCILDFITTKDFQEFYICKS